MLGRRVLNRFKSVFTHDSNFIEADYLALHPDVAAAVKAGTFKSGYDHYLNHGKAEGRPPSLSASSTSREKAVFHMIDRNGNGLEIGPSHNPIAPKKKGYKVHILDHCSTEELRAKYQKHGLNLDNIEEVDFVWRGQSLPELVGKKHCYDWIIASHVVEHIPDLISFLQQCDDLLNNNGVISLVVPDKRYCFDFFQPVSTTGMLLDANAVKRLRPSPGQVFDHCANASSFNGNIAWSENQRVEPNGLVHSFKDAKERWERASQTDEYLDVHCWRFTPESFSLVLSDLAELGLINLEIKAQFPTSGCEFYVSLGKIKTQKIQIKNRLETLIELQSSLGKH